VIPPPPPVVQPSEGFSSSQNKTLRPEMARQPPPPPPPPPIPRSEWPDLTLKPGTDIPLPPQRPPPPPAPPISTPEGLQPALKRDTDNQHQLRCKLCNLVVCVCKSTYHAPDMWSFSNNGRYVHKENRQRVDESRRDDDWGEWTDHWSTDRWSFRSPDRRGTEASSSAADTPGHGRWSEDLEVNTEFCCQSTLYLARDTLDSLGMSWNADRAFTHKMVCQPWQVRQWILQAGMEKHAENVRGYMIERVVRWMNNWKKENKGSLTSDGLWTCTMCGKTTFIEWDCCHLCGSLRSRTYGRREKF
jgi:hypothetical protein